MKMLKWRIMLVMVLCFLGIVICGQNAFAGNKWVSGASITGFKTYCGDGTMAYTRGTYGNDTNTEDCEGHDGFGESYFHVSLTFKSACDGECSISEDFVCCGTHDQDEYIGDATSIDEYDDGDGYVALTLHTPGNFQPVCGGIDVPSKKKLSAVAINLKGDEIGSNPFDTDEVDSGSEASVTAPQTKSGDYYFQGWKTSKTASSASTSYSKTTLEWKENISSDKTVYAVYAKDRTLTGTAVDCDNTSTSLSSISGLGNKTNKVHYNTSASVTMGTNSNYTFQYWQENSSNTSRTYSVGNLLSDTTAHAIYCHDRTLTLKAVDESGNSLSSISGLSDQTTTVHHKASANLTRGTATGYTFIGFRSNASSGSYITGTSTSSAVYVSGSNSPKETFNVKSMTADKTEYAVYVRNEFAGKLTASGGIDTGWVETDQAKTGEIDCDNYDTGCTATFQPALKTIKGTGNTVYSVQRSKNGGSWSSDININPASPFAPSTTGTNINKASGNYSEKLYPGESVCYKITFRPYGAKGNTDTVTLSACVTAKTSTFKGKVTAMGVTDGPKNTGLVNSNTTKRYYVRNCSPTEGCIVSFNHSMERAGSIGSSDWVVSRTSNLTDNNAKVGGNSIAIANNGSVATGTFKPSTDTSQNNQGKIVRTGNNLKLYPGMVVCEKITFAKNNTYNSNDPGKYAQAYAQACVMALGSSQPGDPDNPDIPEDPGGEDEKSSIDSSFLNIKVRNMSVSKYSKYQHMVYAKPGDDIRFRATYNPNLQYTYYLKAERVKINSGTANPSSGRSTYQLGTYFNTLNRCNINNRNVINCWNSGFGLSSNFSDASRYNYAKLHTVGNTDKLIEPLDAYTVAGSDVGGEKGETVKTNSATKVNKDGDALLSSNTNKDDRTTAKQVTFDCDAKVNGACSDGSGNNNVGTVDTSQRTKTAYFRIPYNFTTGAEVTTSEDTPVFAGEATSINFRIDVNPKYNDETMSSGDRDYTTIAKDVRRELVVYRPNSYTNARKSGGVMSGAREADVCSAYFGHANDEVNCGYAGNETGTLSNNDANRYETMPHNFSKTFYAQDLPAGTDICVAVAVFPATSGADTNYNDMQYSRSWTISPSKCYKIAKRPSLQVWGGNIYTSVGAETATARKNNLQGYTDYNSTHTNSYRVGAKLGTDYIFGSWGELGLVSSGRVKELSSGATLGYVGNNGDSTNVLNLWPSHHPAGPSGNNAVINGRAPGGTTNVNGTLCARSPLTFANSPCGSATSTVGQLGNSVSKRSSEDNKASVIEKYIYGGSTTVGGAVNLADETDKMRDDSVYYYYSGDNNLTLPGGRVEIGKTKVVHSDKTVTITGDVIYEDGYKNFSDMPKLIVYAKGDIKIGCNVGRVDGILIAEGAVTTCVDGSGNAPEVNSSLRSNQLVINGTIVAKKLVPNRTYGAGTGANSIVPAEIINFDPTLYQWGGQKMESQGVDTNLDVTYSREIAPRL